MVIPLTFPPSQGPAPGTVRQMRIRIGLLAQPESMRSIIDATQREQLHGLACTWWLNRDEVTKQNYPQMNLPG